MHRARAADVFPRTRRRPVENAAAIRENGALKDRDFQELPVIRTVLGLRFLLVAYALFAMAPSVAQAQIVRGDSDSSQTVDTRPVSVW